MPQLTSRRAAVLLVAALAGAPALAACDPIDEKVCSSGEYPVKASDGSGGSTCIKTGAPIPSGYTTYEPGNTPTTP